MTTECIFPVKSLFGNITQDMMTYVSANARGAINNNLIPRINIFDNDCKCTGVACIDTLYNADNELYYQVSISGAFAQFLWIICDITIKSHDLFVTLQEFKLMGIHRESIPDINEQAAALSDEQIKELFKQQNIDVAPNAFRSYIIRINELLRSDITVETMIEEQLLALSLLIGYPYNLDIERLRILDMKSGYGQTTNACTIKGISFILLHELAHHTLGHLLKPEEPQDEIDADQSAFWAIESDTNSQEKFTAMIGIISMMFAILIKDYGSPSDGIHQREDKRLFNILDLIQSQNPKYVEFTLWLFTLWQPVINLPNFPELDLPNPEEFDKVRTYFQAIT